MENVLVLNRNYLALNFVGWQRALSLVVSEKAEIVEETDNVVRSVYKEFKVPSVIRLLYSGVYPKRKVKFTRINVLKRDSFQCQYCGDIFSKNALTMDHVVPVSRGGRTAWENIVASCKPCNEKKGDRLPHEAGLKLRRKPKEPSFIPYVQFGIRKNNDVWLKYMPQLKIVEHIE